MFRARPWLLLLFGAVLSSAVAPPAERLLVDFLPSPAIGVGSARPRFTFSPVASAGGARNTTVASARVVVRAAGGALFWDSGDVPQNASADGAGVRCGVEVPEGRAFTWTLTWRAAGGGSPSSLPSAPARFVTALRSDAGWRGARWVGAGHGQFRARFDLSAAAASLAAVRGAAVAGGNLTLTALAFLSAPGGAVLTLNGDTALPGGDRVGVSAWFDWTRSLPSTAHDLTPLLLLPAAATRRRKGGEGGGAASLQNDAQNAQNELLLTIGCGSWCPCHVPTWDHSGRAVLTAAGAQPLARLLLVISSTDDAGVVEELLVLGTGTEATGAAAATAAAAAAATAAVAVAAAAAPQFSSRAGPVVSSSSWLGATLDHTLGAEQGWSSPARLVPHDTLALDLPGAGTAVDPLPQPPMATFAPVAADQPVSVAPAGAGGGSVYKMGRMVMGTAAVAAGAWGGAGRIRLEFCESLLDTGGCLRMAGYAANGTTDIHIVDDKDAVAGATPALAGAFSWRGFLYVIVTPEGGATFRGGLRDLSAQWTGLQLEEASSVAFEGGAGGAAPMLAQLRDLVARSFRSNLMTGLPTDCPTREKHTWLGDSMDVQLGAQYVYWAPSVFGAFVGQALAAQAPNGFVPVVVPCHQGVDAASNDLSWTTGFPMGVHSLRRFYGGGAGVAGGGVGAPARSASPPPGGATFFTSASWAALRAWTDGQLSNATARGRPGHLPDFFVYGDESGKARTGPANVTATVSRRCAAACFLVALGAMAELAEKLGEAADAARWSTTLKTLRGEFDSLFWLPNGTYTTEAEARQTVDGMALAAGVGSTSHRVAAAAGLLADVTARNFSLTVGSVGQKRLLATLSSLVNVSTPGAAAAAAVADAGPGHDAALRVALGTAEPSWGYWLSKGATTCWESWTAMTQPHDDHHHGSRNHAWLCGGLAEWLHADLGGIAPVADGFGAVSIAPKISSTLGPAGVAMTLQTVRGPVTSHWTRGDAALSALRERRRLKAQAARTTTDVVADAGVGAGAGEPPLLLLLLQLRVVVPPGVTADVELPLLGVETAEHMRHVAVSEGARLLWGGSPRAAVHEVDGARVMALERSAAPGVCARLRLRLGSGTYELSVRWRDL